MVGPVTERPITEYETAVLNHVVAHTDDRSVLHDGAQQWIDDARRLYGPNQARKWQRAMVQRVTAFAESCAASGASFVCSISAEDMAPGSKIATVTSLSAAADAIAALMPVVAEAQVLAALKAKVDRHGCDGTWADGTPREGYASAKKRLGDAYETLACRTTRERAERGPAAEAKQKSVADGSYVPAWSNGVALKDMPK